MENVNSSSKIAQMYPSSVLFPFALKPQFELAIDIFCRISLAVVPKIENLRGSLVPEKNLTEIRPFWEATGRKLVKAHIDFLTV